MPQDSPPPSRFALSPRAFAICMAGAFEGGLVLLALFLGQWLEPPPPKQVHWTWDGLLWGLGATLPMLAAMFLIERVPFPPFERLNKIVDQILVPLFSECTLVDLAVIAILAGLGEEALFRGVVQKFLSDQLNVWLALVLASILFGLAHMVTATYAVLAALMGLYLGGLLIYCDNLLPPIVCHAAYDFVTLIYLVRQHRRRPAMPLEASQHDSAPLNPSSSPPSDADSADGHGQ